MLEEAADERERRQSHRADPSLLSVIPVGERNPLLLRIDVDDASIFHRHPIGIAAKVEQQLVGRIS